MFQLPDTSCILLPTRVNSETIIAGQDSLLEVASKAFLKEQFNWIRTFRSAASGLLRDRSARVLEFGPERCVPPTLLRRLSSQVIHFDFERSIISPEEDVSLSADQPSSFGDDVAIIGMACNVSGAEDLPEFWKIILEGKSQHQELTSNGRFVMETSHRPIQPGDNRKWYGNLIEDVDAFDYRFFRKNIRESVQMDPQQRLLLQAAYQAVAQSGYYQTSGLDKRIGCFMGMVGTDYENNISHHLPNAFSATGALRSYISGKVSHYFGWTGPGMTVDTACSASTVAIHQACKAILGGECSAALAGGTNSTNSPMFFQNLSAGSFLSHTGQCKPFDAKADGYCRGEGIGAVFLRKLKDAVANGDQILGVIKATAINQNLNTTPIFVPNPPSLIDLFENVIEKSGLDVRDISVVEAHGTGTAVGDPAEYGSIRKVLGGSARSGLSKPLQIGSLKGLIGHTEGASGVLALIKVLLMMHYHTVPPQASFDTISPSIKALPSDNMEITKNAIPWTDDHQAVLINNYGAAGSNASMVIKQAPQLSSGPGVYGKMNTSSSPTTPFKTPIYISGLDDKAIQAYTTILRDFVAAAATSGHAVSFADLAFNINRQSNWSLSRALVFDASSTEDLLQRSSVVETFQAPTPRPVILCFGGQVSKFVGLDREVFGTAAILRHHLNECDKVCKQIGAGSIYPSIFQREPIGDPSVLQPLLFSIQYASAKSWIGCGVEPAVLVGHSFGELTALCVSSVLSLHDALTMIHGRSKIIKETWGAEKGSMMAVEADLVEVESLLLACTPRLIHDGRTQKVNIACFNGPRSFTLAGSCAAIDVVQDTISAREATQPILKHKRLDVTNAFHSALVEHLQADLEILGRKVRFQSPQIPLERATKEQSNDALAASYVAKHMRDPVFFDHAVQRINGKYPEAIWLEAGSNSTITTMANKALGMPKISTFQPVNVTSDSQALQQLVATTLNLWKAGVRVTFWPHSRHQTYEYKSMILPGYKFEKHRHWLDFKEPLQAIVNIVGASKDAKPPEDKEASIGLFTLLGRQAHNELGRNFIINTTTQQYRDIISGYAVGRTAPSWPSTLSIELALRAITSVEPHLGKSTKVQPQVYNVKHHLPIPQDTTRGKHLEIKRDSASDNIWGYKFMSKVGANPAILHTEGQMSFLPYDDARSCLEFSRYSRLVTHDRCLQTLKSTDDADDVIQGGAIYKVFANVISFKGDRFRGLQKVVGRTKDSAGKIVKPREGDSHFDSALSEVFLQVCSIWANCMARHQTSTNDALYELQGFEQWTRSPDSSRNTIGARHGHDRQTHWHVLAQHNDLNHNSFTSDIFVFDSASGALEEVILGLKYGPFDPL